MARSDIRSTRGNAPASAATKRAARPAAIPAAPVAVAIPAAPAALPVKDETMDTTTNTTNTATDQAKTMFTDATERAKTGFVKGQQLFGEMGEFNKGNVEAMIESSKIAAKGVEQLGQAAAAYVRSSFEEAQANARTLASAGSPTEFLKLQGDFMRTSFDRMVAETSRTTETMLKLAGEVAQPISNRVALAVDKFKVAA